MKRRTLLIAAGAVWLPASAIAAQQISSTPPVPVTSHVIARTDYPAASFRLREEGVVTIQYVVQTNGSVGDCRIVKTSGVPLLDIAACLTATRRWKFKPATQNGKPVAQSLESDVTFELPSESL